MKHRASSSPRLAPWLALTLIPLFAGTAALAHSPAVQFLSFGPPPELGLGVTGIGVSERSERLLAQVKTSGRNSPSLLPAGLAGQGPIGAALGANAMASSIQAWAFDSREQLAGEVESRVDASGRAIDALARQGSRLKDSQAGAIFAAAVRASETAEKQLRRSLEAARSAWDRKWGEARTAVAADFTAYAAAVAHVESVMAEGSADSGGQEPG